MGFINNDRNQMNLLGYSLTDFVPKNAKCRFVIDLVKQLDLSELYARYSNQGSDAYEPSAMLATWFYGYTERVFTTRKLEERCQRDIYFMYVSSNLRPDHSSLSRFRKNNQDLMSDYFVQIIRLAWQQGLADFKEIAIDGSKFQAASSPRHLKNAEDLEKALKRVRADIEEYMHKAELFDDENDDDISNIPKLRTKIKELKKLEKELKSKQNNLNKRRQQIRSQYRQRHKINLAEPEAQVMNNVNGRFKLPAYNAQLSVDTKTQLIVANEAISDSVDFDQFNKQHQNVENNLNDDRQRVYVADAGYHNLEQLEYVYTHDINAVIAGPHKENTFKQTRSKYFRHNQFIYDNQHDYYCCPAGHKLTYSKNYNKGKWRGRIYSTTACKECAIRHNCLPADRPYKNLRRENRRSLAEQMAQKSKSIQGNASLKRRAMSVETVFGNIKHNLGFRRFHIKGLNAAHAELNLVCIAHNINKMFRIGLLNSQKIKRQLKSFGNHVKEQFIFILYPKRVFV